MSRLSPLIVRRVGRHAVAVPHALPQPIDAGSAAVRLDDLRLFATGWVGGLIFFGTLLS